MKRFPRSTDCSVGLHGSKSGLLVVPESGAESDEVCDWSKEWIVLLIQRLDCLIGPQSGVFDWSKE